MQVKSKPCIILQTANRKTKIRKGLEVNNDKNILSTGWTKLKSMVAAAKVTQDSDQTTSLSIERIVLLDFIHRLVSQKLRN
jgi:hypothetical protein